MWNIEYYEELDNSCPVKEFLDALPKKERAKIFQAMIVLQKLGPELPFPYSSQVEGKLRELRIQHGKDKFRILYYGDKNRSFVLLHAFQKRSQKLPDVEIATALNRMSIDEEHKRKEK